MDVVWIFYGGWCFLGAARALSVAIQPGSVGRVTISLSHWPTSGAVQVKTQDRLDSFVSL